MKIKNSTSKDDIEIFYDYIAEHRKKWKKRNKYFYDEHYKYLRFLIPEGKKVLKLGSSTGEELAILKTSIGVGVEQCEKKVQIARSNYPNLEFIEGDFEHPDILNKTEGPFDFIIISGALGMVNDCQNLFNQLHKLSDRDTKLIISYQSWFWAPVLKLAEKIGLRMPRNFNENWLSTDSIANMLELANFQVIKGEWRQLVPISFFGIGSLVNKYIAPLPMIRKLCLNNYMVVRSLQHIGLPESSVTIVIPCKNEAGNIEQAVNRIPRFCNDLEIIFIEGGSKDGTVDEIRRVITQYQELDIKLLLQNGKGKWDAVKQGFKVARGEVLMILDADLTMPPEELPKFYNALVRGSGEFIHGTRMVYLKENQAMRTLNQWANSIFSVIFTWLLNARYTDTLCGTKVLTKKNFLLIEKECSYFGDFDPFGDFYLIFGAQKRNLKTVEIPIRYRARVYGETQISRFRHGFMLLGVVLFAFKKFKAL
jgi:hypothetical protein